MNAKLASLGGEVERGRKGAKVGRVNPGIETNRC